MNLHFFRKTPRKGLAAARVFMGGICASLFVSMSLIGCSGGGVSGQPTVVLVAYPQQLQTIENTPVALTLLATDPAAKPLTYTITTQPLHGTLTGALPNLTYTPNTAYFGADSFDFQVTNGTQIASATITLNVQEVVGATPIAADLSLSMMENTSIAGNVTAVDPDNEPLTFALATPSPDGTVTLAANGAFQFTPTPYFSGITQFTFTASDPHPNVSQAGTVTIVVVQTVFDRDGDGLTDADEKSIYKTNPYLADTDGDGLSDGQEVAQWDRVSYRFNPLIADIPQLDFVLLASPSASIDMTTTSGTSKTIANTVGTSTTNSITTSQEISNATSQEKSHMFGVTLGIEQGFKTGFDGGSTTNLTFSATTENTWSSSSEHVETNGTERTQENSRMAEQTDEYAKTHELSQSGGSVNVPIQIINKGDLSFTLNNLFLSVYYLDYLQSNPFVMVGNLSFDPGALITPFPTMTLGPGQMSGPINFTTGSLDLTTALDTLKNANGLIVREASSEMLDINGIPYAQYYADIAARDALIVVDYGPLSGRGRVKKHVSVSNSISNPSGTTITQRTLLSILQDTLGIPAVQDVATNELLGLGAPALMNATPVAPETTIKSHWVVAHGQLQADGSMISTTYTSPITAYPLNPPAVPDPLYLHGIDLSTIIVKPGDMVELIYLSDTDGDNNTDREEVLNGTNNGSGDSDGDGLTDHDEVAGWMVDITDNQGIVRSVRVASNPNLADSDGDGLWDGEEAGYALLPGQAAGVRKVDTTVAAVAANMSDPKKEDTDADGIPDSLDLQKITYTSIDFTSLTATSDLLGNVLLNWAWTDPGAGVAYKPTASIKAYVYKQFSSTGTFFDPAQELAAVSNTTPPSALRCTNGLNCWTQVGAVTLAGTANGLVTDYAALTAATGGTEEVRYLVYFHVQDPAAPATGNITKGAHFPMARYGGNDKLTITVTDIAGIYYSNPNSSNPLETYKGFAPNVYVRSFIRNGAAKDLTGSTTIASLPAQQPTTTTYPPYHVTPLTVDNNAVTIPVSMTIDAARVDGTCYGFDLFLRDYYPGWQGWWQFPTAQNDYIYAQASINMRRLTPNTTPGLLDVGIQELVNSEVRPDTVEMCYSAALDRWTVTPNPAPPVDTTGTYKTTDGLGVQLPRTEAVTSSPFISAGMSQNGQVNSIYTTGDFRYTLNVDTHNGNFQFHADVEPYGDDPNNQFWQRVNSVSNITATLSVSR